MYTQEKDFTADNLTGTNNEGPDANRPVRVLTASSIIGDKVENTQGEDLGDIKDIMVNLQNGSIEYVVLSYGGILGIGSKYYAIPFSSLKLNPSRQIFILDKDLEQIKNAPGFDKDHWPETNSHYNDVNTYWGGFMGVNAAGGPV